VAKTFDFQCHHERNDTQNFIVHMYCIGHITDTVLMQNCWCWECEVCKICRNGTNKFANGYPHQIWMRFSTQMCCWCPG